ncbi:MAG: two-component regulator propeller domain-containing protein [Bacteroidota bacterium]
MPAQRTSFIEYGIEQGLVQSQVQSIVQDNDGNLWIGTLGGLSKYNGKSFTSYSKKDSLAEDWVTTAYKDKNGNLWFGHWGGGVTMYDYENKKFQNLKIELYTRFKSVNAILQDKTGSYWIGTEGSGIFKFDPVANKMISISKKEGLSSENITGLCMDTYGNIWIATDNGICVYDSKFDISSPSSYNYVNVSNGLGSDNITCIYSGEKEIWVGTKDAGVFVISLPEDFTVKSIDETFAKRVSGLSLADGLGANDINCIFRDSKKRMWIGTRLGGVTKLYNSEGGTRIFKTYSIGQGLNYYNVNAVTEDREGNIWIGTDVGLNQYRGERFQLFDERDKLVNNLVWSTICDQEGNIWLGTNNGVSKISVTQTGDGLPVYSIQNFTTADGLNSNAVLAVYEDPATGDIWFGCAFGGICRLKKGEKKVESMNNEQNMLKDVSVFSICSDKFDNLWFGTRLGASRYDKGSNSFQLFTTDEGLGGNNIYRIFRDSKGNLWFGALGGKLSMYDGTSFKLFNESDGIRHRFILCISEDKKGQLWFGVYGGGIYKYDGKQFTNYTVDNGLSSPSPYAIIADKENYIWIGTTNGIDKFDPESFAFTHYGKQEGFYGVETNPNAICTDKQGNIWFGTIMGAVKFNPDEDRLNNTEPLINITGMKVFLKDTLFPIDARFPYNMNHITFEFIGISLTNPSGVRYKYMIEGFDEDWSPETALNEAVYANLPPGEYTFMVKACNNNHQWNTEPAKYRFIITPPFWKTKWFYMLVTVGAMLIIYLADRWRTSNLKRTKRELEHKVEQRTLELAQKNEELAERNKDITDSIRYAKRIQEAILPPAKTVRQHLPESFILYKPKDIVSGDFYWVREKDGYAMVAAVDCTGHGVPGAFMSIVGYNLLNKAVDELGKMDAAEILNRVNKGLSETLKQTSEDESVKDGMDVSLCLIDFKAQQMLYAGAYNPLYLVRNKALQEIEGDNIAIGAYSEDKTKVYTNHKVLLEKGDMIYLFSDGFADQFGGPDGKKFKYNNFKALLLEASPLPMEEQKMLLNGRFESWKGSLEQVDDIMVIGIRV